MKNGYFSIFIVKADGGATLRMHNLAPLMGALSYLATHTE
jgi:hypothetical protein